MSNREICPCCNIRPVAIVNHRYGKTYYRKKCDQCYRLKKEPKAPGWIRAGYKKKDRCDKCGFKFKVAEQATIVYVDGNVNNNDWINLKTICLNCQAEIKLHKLPWKATITPDF